MAKKEKSNLDNTLANIEKSFGKGSIYLLNSKDKINIPRISTGSIALDQALGGGLPIGRLIEIFGPASSGKTTLTFSVISEAQKQGQSVAFIDAEQAVDIEWMQKCGVDIDKLLFSQPDYGEQALNIVEELAESKEISLIIVDSVASLTPKAEIEGEIGQSHMGLQARMMGQACRKLAAIANKNQVTIIFLNQIRMKIGLVFGNPETVPGGEALKFFASIRIDLRSREKIKKVDEIVANKIRAKIVKNKTSAPFKEAIFEVWYDAGLCPISDIINIALSQDIIIKKGAWFSYQGNNIAQGQEKLRNLLKEDNKFFEQIKGEIYLS